MDRRGRIQKTFYFLLGNIIPELCQLIFSVHIGHDSYSLHDDPYGSERQASQVTRLAMRSLQPISSRHFTTRNTRVLRARKTAFVGIEFFKSRFFRKNRFSPIDPCPNKYCLKSSFPTKYWHLDSRSYFKTRFN
jgi:hypothetical protein